MKRIGLLSDNHSYIDDHILGYFAECDEIWHAGDIGDPEVTDRLADLKPLRAVYGNIDDARLRRQFPLDQHFVCEGLDVWITHIGGYPGNYQKRVREGMQLNPPGLFISGHSHILKVMPDPKYQLLHINPGACGHHGFHQIRTLVRFSVANGVVSDLQVVELGKRGRK
ncbi:metallophosphoesterase family protein [Flavilitoribacter nigricans]|uniref:YfcE family phosphodiesterase n=1 Tax=Flavilitoribacter nigricans (strain ATCC 23147 / DSM 23189 / NBRC 102662 / NCIMB 1420 / SS-2) TaxID=1122177 RepID=A0A2D0NJ99_FLAN2|nr:metallophosphoesterase family protein [Flavilitoribacter nigricans]PHN08571.1 YfcE family phosphodiesterase [Flavilitoribacter nigricans DSM 23189 = NBRC 102662]